MYLKDHYFRQEQTILKWQQTVESIIDQIDDICIDSNIDVKEMGKDACSIGQISL